MIAQANGQSFSPWTIGKTGCQVLLPMDQSEAADTFDLYAGEEGDSVYMLEFSTDSWSGFVMLLVLPESMEEWTESEQSEITIVNTDAIRDRQFAKTTQPLIRNSALEKQYPGSLAFRGRWVDYADNIYLAQSISLKRYILIQYMMVDKGYPEPAKEIQTAFFETPVLGR